MVARRLDGFAFTYRSALLALAVSPIAWAALAAPAPGGIVLALGATLCAAGVALRLASVRWLGKRARVTRAKATVLVAGGPYAHVRNPLYLAALLIILGLGLMAGLAAWSLLPLIAAVAIYDRAVRHEERTLVASHSDTAEEYLRAVPRWLPRLSAYGSPPGDREPWAVVVNREWRLVLGLPVAMLALAALGTIAGDLRAPVTTSLERIGLSLEVLLAVSVGLGAAGNAAKTKYDLWRKARRRNAAAGQQPIVEDCTAMCLAVTDITRAAS